VTCPYCSGSRLRQMDSRETRMAVPPLVWCWCVGTLTEPSPAQEPGDAGSHGADAGRDAREAELGHRELVAADVER
jgi:hypothetical protein